MGKLLRDVLTIEKEGLVGYTDIGEEVKLGSPQMCCVPIFPLFGEANLDEIKEDAIKGLRAIEEDFYFHIGGFEKIGNGTFVYYNAYKERK